MQIKKLVKWLLFLCLAPAILFVVVLSLGGIGTMLTYRWATNSDGGFENFFVAIVGEIAWLSILILVCSYAA